MDRKPAYLIVHKDHALSVRGINAGAEMATRMLARYLVRAGRQVIVAAQLVENEQVYEGVEFWDLGPSFDVSSVLTRIRPIGPYHLISAGRALPVFESRSEPLCLSRTLITHDRTGNDTGIHPAILSRVVDHILCVSHAQADSFAQAGGDRSKMTIIHNGVDLETFAASDSSQRDWKRLIFVGALVQDKGVHVLLQAFANLAARHQGLTLDIYGSSSLWGREKMFDEPSVERQIPGVRFHGKAEQRVIAEALKKGGICVIPSIWFDPFPLTSLEAQATGCPVVAFDVGGLKEGILDGQTGVVVRDISAEALTGALDSLLRSPQKLQEMSVKAVSHIREYFTWERLSADVIALCEKNVGSAQAVESSKPAIAGAVGILSTWNQECGLATYARFLLNALPAGSCTVFAEDTPTARRADDEPWVVRSWQHSGVGLDAVESEILKRKISLLHLNFHDHSYIDHSQLLPFLSRLKSQGVSVISHLHTTFTSDPRLSAFVRAVDTIIVHTPENRLQVLAAGAPSGKVSVIPHGVEIRQEASAQQKEAVRLSIGVQPGEKMLATFGFVQPNKGIEALIEAVIHLKQRGIPVKGYVAGKASDAGSSATYLQALKKLASDHGVTEQVLFADRFLSESEVGDCLAAADLVFMNYSSQYYESSGACALALGAGALVATSLAPNFGIFQDAVWHLTSGFPAGPSAELLLTDQNLRNEILDRARVFCSEHSWAQIAQKMQVLYGTFGVILEAGSQVPHPQNASKSTTVVDFEKDLEDAEYALKAGEMSRAEAILQSLEPYAQHSSRFWKARGTHALSSERPAEARPFFERCLTLDPENAKALAGLGVCCMSIGEIEAGHAYLVRSSLKDPDFLFAIKNLIATSSSLGRFEELEAALRRYLASHEDDSEMLYCLAGCLYRKGDRGASKAIVERILTLKPDHVNALDLKEQLQEKAAAAPENNWASVDMRLAEIEEDKRQKKFVQVHEALDSLAQGNTLSAFQQERVLIVRGEVLALEGRTAESEQIFEQILIQNPGCGRAMSGKGALAASRGNLDQAKELFTKALQFPERRDVALTGLGVCAQWTSDHEKAWDLFHQALKVNCENEQALFGIVQIGLKHSRYTQVEEALRNYLELHPLNIEYLYCFAGCLYAQKRFDEALSELSKILLVDPGNDRARELESTIRNGDMGRVVSGKN